MQKTNFFLERKKIQSVFLYLKDFKEKKKV